jgi:hypothetical protein
VLHATSAFRIREVLHEILANEHPFMVAMTSRLTDRVPYPTLASSNCQDGVDQLGGCLALSKVVSTPLIEVDPNPVLPCRKCKDTEGPVFSPDGINSTARGFFGHENKVDEP